MPRLTPTGAAAGVGGIILVLLGAATGYAVLAVIGAAGVLATVAGWLATAAPARLEVERHVQASRVVRGAPVIAVVAVRNTRRRPAPATVAVDPVARDGAGVGRLEVPLPALGPGRQASTTYEVPTDHRGHLTVGPLSLERSDPFGLWVAPRSVGGSTTLVVVPRVVPMSPRPGGRTRHLEGPTKDRAPTGSITFHALREYVPGDDLRRVHWKTSARTGTLMVREHVDTSRPSTVVVLDARAERIGADAFEEAVDVAASVIAASLDHGFPVRLLTTAGHRERATASGPAAQGIDRCLAGVARSGTEDLGRMATEVLSLPDHDTLVVITGDPHRADVAAVGAMARRFDTAVLLTLRPDAGAGAARFAVPAGVLPLDAADAADAVRRWMVGGAAPSAMGRAG